MNEGTFHPVIEFARRDPLGFACILLGIPLMLLLLAAAAVRPIHAVIV